MPHPDVVSRAVKAIEDHALLTFESEAERVALQILKVLEALGLFVDPEPAAELAASQPEGLAAAPQPSPDPPPEPPPPPPLPPLPHADV